MKKKVKFPYDYRTVPLKHVKGSATFIGKPSSELLEAVNKMAEIAFTKIKKMKTKQILLDGGPADGDTVIVEEGVKVYECFTQPKMSNDTKPDDVIPPPIKHLYKEDTKVEGHFIYAGLV